VRHNFIIAFAALLSSGAAAWGQGAPEDPFRAPCDQAAAHLAASKPKEALAVLEPFLKDPALAKSPQRDRLCYYLGCAGFALENDIVAGRALSRLAPFETSPFAPHARYLLGRIHHRAGEYTEAITHYDAVPPLFDRQIAAAKQALGNAQLMKDQPAEKARLEALVKAPPPDFVPETIFHAGVVLYEEKAFADAVQKFALFAQKDKRPAWLEEARLRAGMCQVRMSQNAEALKALQPLQDHPRLARTARWWMARAILATPEGKAADAAEHLKKAAAAPETEGGPGSPEILLALGDALDRAGKSAEAVEVYKQLVASGGRVEEALARLVGSHAAAKQYAEVDAAAARFEKQYPGSVLLGDVLLRRADGMFAQAQAANKPELFVEALKRYERVLGSASGAGANSARYRTALAQYRLGKIADALDNLRAIAEADRSGELMGAYYLQGECLIRLTPPAEDAADAIAAEGVLQNMQEAVAQLQKFVPQAGPQTPEVMIKLAGCFRQQAVLLADPAERTQAANGGREIYEAFRAQFPTHPLRPVAEYERANCYALAGDTASAIAKLERFRAEPLASSPVAPLANLRHAQLYRAAGQPQPAATILAECRARHEAALLKDPARSAWVPLIRYHHAAALKELKQAAEAAQILESVVKEYGASEWAEPSRRLLKEVKP
jgi:TolA-binding protein